MAFPRNYHELCYQNTEKPSSLRKVYRKIVIA